MVVENRIRQKLTRSLSPVHLELENESHMHSVPKGSETHFRAVIVSALFIGKTRVARQRQVYAILDEDLRGGVHALALRTYTPEEWEAMGGAVDAPSPECLGGAKKDQKS